MAIQRKQLNIMKARRRVRLRSALLLSMLACMVSLLFGAAMGLGGAAMPPALQLILEAAVTVVAFGMTAYLGLLVLDGDQRKILPLFTLTRGQIFWLTMLGMLLTAPMTLMGDTLEALFLPQQAAIAGESGKLFLLTMVKSALLVPVCEELFFRGYLYQALSRISKHRAMTISSLIFALAHGIGLYGFLPRIVLGMLLAALMEKTGTLLAPMLVHGCYNAAIVIIAYSGAAPLFSGLGPMNCAFRMMLCIFCLYAFRRTWTTRGLKNPMRPLDELRFSKKERLMMAAVALLVILAEVLS